MVLLGSGAVKHASLNLKSGTFGPGPEALCFRALWCLGAQGLNRRIVCGFGIRSYVGHLESDENPPRFSPCGPVFVVQDGFRRFSSAAGPSSHGQAPGDEADRGPLSGIDVDRRGGKGTLPARRPPVAEVRQTSMILAIRLVKDKTHRVPTVGGGRGRIVYVHGLSRGVLLRPLGDVIYFMPPYVITEDEIRLTAEVVTGGIERAAAE
jgi:hypothetical protein